MDLEPTVSIGNGVTHRERTNCNCNWEESLWGNRIAQLLRVEQSSAIKLLRPLLLASLRGLRRLQYNRIAGGRRMWWRGIERRRLGLPDSSLWLLDGPFGAPSTAATWGILRHYRTGKFFITTGTFRSTTEGPIYFSWPLKNRRTTADIRCNFSLLHNSSSASAGAVDTLFLFSRSTYIHFILSSKRDAEIKKKRTFIMNVAVLCN